MPKDSEGGNQEFPRGIGKPATRALANAGYTHLDQLASVREKDLAALHGMGPKALGILRTALRGMGKDFHE
jgi:predicted flap endonuclease-1-like 5' DNA nuclease